MNSTIDITVGRKGDVICRPAEWTDVVIFFFLNYGLHALTVMPAPGATPLITAQLCLYAILAPFAGSLRALLAIQRCTKLEADELAMAHKSGALCMLWWSEDIPGGDLVEVSPRLINIHGQHPVEIPGKREWVKGVFVHKQRVRPDPYRIVEVPEDFIVKALIEPATNDGSATGNHGRREPKLLLSCNYNSIRSLAAILQILYSSLEIYEARGVQLQQFGYAAYSLTVIPYTIMSLINLVASLCEPQYPARFLVHYRANIDTQASAIDLNSGHEGGFGAHDSLRVGAEGGDMLTRITTSTQRNEVVVSGAVGVASQEPTRKIWSVKERCLTAVVILIGLSSLAAPYIIIKLLTNFHGGQSTRSQRIWIMSWLVVGQYFAPTFFICILSPQLLRRWTKGLHKGVNAFDKLRNWMRDQGLHEKVNAFHCLLNQARHWSLNLLDKLTKWMRDQGVHERVNVFYYLLMLCQAQYRLLNPFYKFRIRMYISLLLVMAISTIGGFVVIAKMIRHSDVCKTI